MPTVTTVRIKAIMTGALASFFETKEDFTTRSIPEDSVFHQAKNFKVHKPDGKRVIYSGDHIWIDMYANYFDIERHYSSHNIRDLDTVDESVTRDMHEIFDNSNNNFTFDLLVMHTLGIDHAGHTFHANHSQIERKVQETEVIIKQLIDRLDDDTVLLLYGDHGMTNDGNHGGGSQLEIKTVLFAYCKSGFHMLKNQAARAQIESDSSLNRVKQLDLAPIASYLLN